MRVSDAIEKLEAIKAKFGNTTIVGGLMYDGIPLNDITVVDNEGTEIWPEDKSNGNVANEIEGIVLS